MGDKGSCIICICIMNEWCSMFVECNLLANMNDE